MFKHVRLKFPKTHSDLGQPAHTPIEMHLHVIIIDPNINTQ